MKKIFLGLMAVSASLVLAACGTQASQASYNVKQESENFNVDRRLVAINTITDEPILTVTGKFSIKADNADGQLEVTVKDDEGNFRNHFIGLSPTVSYVVEDIQGADVSSTRYQVSYLPEKIIPIEFKDGTRG